MKKKYSDFELAVIFKYALKNRVIKFDEAHESDARFLQAMRTKRMFDYGFLGTTLLG
jgi:hypothetical protein